MIFWGIVSCVIGALVFSGKEARPAYTATAVLLPLEETVSALNLRDTPQQGTSPSQRSSYYLGILGNIATSKAVLQREYPYHRGEKDSISQTLIEYLGAPTVPQAFDALLEMAKFEADKSGVIEIAVTTAYPELSAQVANEYVNQLVVYNREGQPTRINENLKFVAQRLTEVSVELSKAEEALVDFQKANVNLVGGLGGNSPDLALESSRLQREIAVKSDLVTTLTKQYEITKLEAAGQAPVIEVLAYAEPKLCVRSEQGRGRTVLTTLAVGLLGTVFLAFVLEYIEKNRKTGRVDRLVELLQQDRKRFRWFFRRPQG